MAIFTTAHPMNRLQAEMDRLFEQFLGPQVPRWTPGGPASNFPAVNLWEDADAYHVEAELPGLALDDVERPALAVAVVGIDARTHHEFALVCLRYIHVHRVRHHDGRVHGFQQF